MVQISSEPNRPRGRSPSGCVHSCAAVDPESKPMYAKKITDAPRSTPLQPKSPNAPVFAGTNGCHSSVRTDSAPQPITIRITATLISTIAALTAADSRTPRTSSAVTAATATAAGQSNAEAGSAMPASISSDRRLPDQPTATVATLSAYSSTRSQPITHATNGPNAARA